MDFLESTMEDWLHDLPDHSDVDSEEDAPMLCQGTEVS